MPSRSEVIASSPRASPTISATSSPSAGPSRARGAGGAEPFSSAACRASAPIRTRWRTGETISIIRCSRPASISGCSIRWSCAARRGEYRDSGRAPLNAVEGFIRQIIGWREYVRGFYWLKMPGLCQANELGATARCPNSSGPARPTCAACDCIRTTREDAYAHHIQRLMVLGNFA
jgi:hypothetical protein